MLPNPHYKNKILIIDDDKDVNDLFTVFLEYSGFQVDSYTNPIQALYQFKDQYDLIFLDLKMPQIDGFRVLQALKKKGTRAIICLITADLQYLEQLKQKIPQIDRYVICKPILLKDLKRKINRLFSEKHQLTPLNFNH